MEVTEEEVEKKHEEYLKNRADIGKRSNVSEWLMWREIQSLKTDQPGDDAADAQTRERINSDEQTLILFAIHRWLSQSRLRGLHNCSSPQRKSKIINQAGIWPWWCGLKAKGQRRSEILRQAACQIFKREI
jgi:hypothetical protein